MQDILVFGQLADAVATSTITIEKTDSVAALKIKLFDKYPQLQDKTFLIAVDNKIASDDGLISDESVIALLPPFSGG